jgi:hypothetical protein
VWAPGRCDVFTPALLSSAAANSLSAPFCPPVLQPPRAPRTAWRSRCRCAACSRLRPPAQVGGSRAGEGTRPLRCRPPFIALSAAAALLSAPPPTCAAAPEGTPYGMEEPLQMRRLQQAEAPGPGGWEPGACGHQAAAVPSPFHCFECWRRFADRPSRPPVLQPPRAPRTAWRSRCRCKRIHPLKPFNPQPAWLDSRGACNTHGALGVNAMPRASG